VRRCHLGGRLLAILLALALAAEPVDLVREALSAHPDVAAADARLRAATDRLDAAGRWMDPMAMVELMNVPTSTFVPNDPMSMLAFRLSQTMPTSGMAAAREAMARAEADAAAHALGEARLAVATKVETAFWRLALARTLAAITAEHVARSRELEAVVRGRYAVGEAGQGAVLRVRVLVERLEQEGLDLAAAVAAREAELRALTGRQGPIATPDSLAVAVPEGDAAAWLARAEASRPGLATMAAMADAARGEAGMARATGRPDLTLSAGYSVRFPGPMSEGDDMVGLGLGANLPLARRATRAETAGALEEAHAQELAREGMLVELRAMLAEHELVWRRAVSRAEVVEARLLPAARQALAAMLADFRAGNLPYAELVDAEVEVLDMEEDLAMARVDTQLMAVAVRSLTGPAPEAP
jgi:outer membrane protein TolC